MNVQKTFSVTVKFSRDDAGITHDVRGKDGSFSSKTQAAMKDTDLEYTSLKAAVIKGITEVLPIQSGIAQAQIVGEISES